MTTKSLKDWKLERFLLGELPPERIKEIKKLADENPEIQERIAILKRSNEDILKQYPSESMIPDILKRYEEDKRQESIKERAKPFGWWRFLYAVPALAAALLIVFVVFYNRETLPPDTRIKGEEAIDFTKTQIIIYKKIADEVEILKDGDQAAAGDLLQIAYVPGEEAYGVILSIDGNGFVTLHYPGSEDASAMLTQEKKVLLRSAYELDDAPDFERFFFITTIDDIDVPEIVRRAKDLAGSSELAKKENLDLPERFNQFSILLNKGEEQ